MDGSVDVVREERGCDVLGRLGRPVWEEGEEEMIVWGGDGEGMKGGARGLRVDIGEEAAIDVGNFAAEV